jgi:hypothetical protein
MDVRIVLDEHLRANKGLDLFVRKPADTPASGITFRLPKALTLSGTANTDRERKDGHPVRTKKRCMCVRVWALVLC